MSGWVKIHRKFTEWEWYSDINTKTLFLHLILVANHKDGKYRGIVIKRGQLLTGRLKLSEQTGLSEQSIRTSLNHLKSTNEITIKSYSKFSIITITNYDEFQEDNQQDDQQSTSNQPATNQQLTTSKNNKNNKNNNSASKNDAHLALFEKLWKHYPNKKGKAQVSKAAMKRIAVLGEEHMLRCITRYVKYVESQDWLKFQNGSTFFNSGYADYVDEVYAVQEEENNAKEQEELEHLEKIY